MVNNTVMDVMRNDRYYDKYSDEELIKTINAENDDYTP